MRSVAYSALIAILIMMSADAFAAAKPYRLELRRVTHRGQTYDANTWDAKVIWFATFFDDSYRHAFAEQHAKINHMGPMETAKWIADQEYLQNKGWEVFISFYTKKDYKKFSLDPDSFWQLYMTTGTGEIVWPTSIEQVSITPYELVMFRHINRWSKCYKVTFPKVELGDSINLTLQSIIGKSQLAWKFHGNK